MKYQEILLFKTLLYRSENKKLAEMRDLLLPKLMSGKLDYRLRSKTMAVKVFYESDVEVATLEWLVELGYEVAFGPDIASDGLRPEKKCVCRSNFN